MTRDKLIKEIDTLENIMCDVAFGKCDKVQIANYIYYLCNVVKEDLMDTLKRGLYE